MPAGLVEQKGRQGRSAGAGEAVEEVFLDVGEYLVGRSCGLGRAEREQPLARNGL